MLEGDLIVRTESIPIPDENRAVQTDRSDHGVVPVPSDIYHIYKRPVASGLSVDMVLEP